MKPDIFKFVVSPCAGAFEETLWIISVIKFDAVDDSLDETIGIETLKLDPPATGECTITISAAAVEPLNV